MRKKMSKRTIKEPTNSEILEAINIFSGDTDKRFDGIKNRLDCLEKGQEEIKLKLDNVAYRFELVELQKRVQILEKKVLSK